MFIVELTYKVELSQVEPHFEAHMAYVGEHYASGQFVASGKKVPRTGGVIFMTASNREQAEAIVKQDPFVIHDIADYRLIEFLPTTTIDALEHLKAI